jgi:dihydropteroate synthase
LGNPFGVAWGSRTYIMGVLNVTPDSFSGDGFDGDPAEAERRVVECVQAGAGLIDIGGESTRPGYQPVALDDELNRVIPAIRSARAATDVPISVDTTKPEVARRALEMGANIVNDVSGAGQEEMLRLVAEQRAGLVLVHQGKGDPGEDVVTAVLRGLGAAVERAGRHGIPDQHIVVDPGLGFGKTWRENFEILRRLRELCSLSLPVLVGPSRKGMIGRVLGVGVKDRIEGSLALTSLAIANGADAVRVHDVQQMSRAARMTDALAR